MFKINFNKSVLAAVASLLFTPMSFATTLVYSQDFDSLDINSPTALSDDGWQVGANVFSPTGQFLFNYFAFPAPNGGAAFSALVNDRGGPDQGTNQLSVYNDYNNADSHAAGQFVQAVVFQEIPLTGAETEANWSFSFDAARGNIEAGTTTAAFITVLDPANGFAQTDLAFVDANEIGFDWSSFELSIFVDASQAGQILQFGFLSTTTNFLGSGMYYDNINVELQPVPLPGALLFMMSAIGGLGFIRRREC